MENSRIFTRCFTRGRHLKLSILTLNQYIYQVPKICRSNLDFVIVGSQNAQSVDILTDEFNRGMKRDEFRNLYRKAIEDFGFMLVKNSSVKDDNQDSIYGQMKADV